jgi:hypothetical protein
VPPSIDDLKVQADAFGRNCGRNDPGPVPQNRCRVVDPCSLASIQPADVAPADVEAGPAVAEGQSTAG